MIRTTDRIAYPSRADAEDAKRELARILGRPLNALEIVFLDELDAACAEGGLDYAFAAAHACNESNWLQDQGARQERNFFGIGHPDDAAGGVRFESALAGARFYVAELLLKLRRTIPPSLFDAPSYAEEKWASVSYVVEGGLGPFPAVKTIDDLNKRFGPNNREAVWMTDPNGPAAIVAKGRALFPDLPDQEEETMPGKTTVRIDDRYTQRSYGTLDGPELWITVHNNGNPNSNRFQEATFVDGGGGDSAVLYHAAADAEGIAAIAALDVKGRHAGNAEGNDTSIAIEMCIGEEPWSAVKENTAQWLAEVVTNSRGVLDYGRYGPENFSLDRVKEHRDWPGANPACPKKLIETDGGVEKVLARARAIVAEIEGGGGSEYAEPRKPPEWTGEDVEAYGETWQAVRRKVTAVKDTHRLQVFDVKGPRVGPDIEKGTEFEILWKVSKRGKGSFYVTEWGTVVGVGNVTPQVTIRKR